MLLHGTSKVNPNGGLSNSKRIQIRIHSDVKPFIVVIKISVVACFNVFGSGNRINLIASKNLQKIEKKRGEKREKREKSAQEIRIYLITSKNLPKSETKSENREISSTLSL